MNPAGTAALKEVKPIVYPEPHVVDLSSLPKAKEGSFIKGFFIAVPISLILWAGILWFFLHK